MSIPAAVPTATSATDLIKPRLRGVIHSYAAVVAAFAGAGVVVGAAALRDAAATLACTVYAITIVGLFAVSAFYHRLSWKSPRAHVRMKRADHSMIFLFIAGTYTPFCLMALPSPVNWWVLAVVWAGAISGVTLKIAWPGSPRWLGVSLYILLGWVIIAVSPTLVDHSSAAVLVLLAVGGVFYSVGGVLYAAKWPDPWPSSFGHHEVFHACTAVAATLHYIAVWLVLAA
ncbi:hemolysin III family protein [Gordonia pseudamarae]|uniref:Hemolysin III family protein n=1 Tax=Gordonia pseudamarae TaxID=2831662 RepID=A0ABX6IFG6_9ACTN|nr:MULTISPECIES: hemolysin III family protein [Gordonia]MBD0020476.1 hemolysin III family protein [Gordonia sp. (in: high G+C Gram-positive bacteria)]QHN25676.1 hemolysin III family protein [Gordonia pseudamarae]QHN34608.1 hemolysin III family protein [Gordonia pseudamarae]